MKINVNLLQAEMLVVNNSLPSNFNINDIKNIVNKTTFPNLYKLIQIALTIPTTSATCERSFSSMRRLKNWMRNSMEQQRFTNLSVLHIEREITNKIECEKLLNIYSKSDRKLQLI